MDKPFRVLVIDDQREFPEADYVAKTAQEGKHQLEHNGPWHLLLLDHDLNSYTEFSKEITGYDIMCWLEENPQFLPKSIALITSNLISTPIISPKPRTSRIVL